MAVNLSSISLGGIPLPRMSTPRLPFPIRDGLPTLVSAHQPLATQAHLWVSLPVECGVQIRPICARLPALAA
jgi:hypothetical protein